MKKAATLILAIMLCLCQVSALANFEDIVYSTVRVLTNYSYDAILQEYDSNHYLYVPQGSPSVTGSAFAVGKKGEPVKYFVTNKHVVSEEIDVTAYIIPKEKVTSSNGTVSVNRSDATEKVTVIVNSKPTVFIILETRENRIPAYVLGVSDRTDLAVIELPTPTTERVPATLRPFEKLGREQVYAAGFPGILDRILDSQNMLLSTPDQCSTTAGQILRVDSHAITGDGEQIVMDAEINGGNSGGPLVDQNGYVLGVNTWEITNTATNISVSVNEVVRMLDQLNIPYMTASSFDWMIVVYAGAGVAFVVLLVLIVLLAGKNKGSKLMLVGVAGDLRGKAFRLNGTVVIGRNRACQIVLPDDAHGVSSRHCTVTVKNNIVTVVDSSTYGTWIDKTKLTVGTPATMKQGQTLYLGSSKHGLMLK